LLREDALPRQNRSTPLPNIPPSFEIKVTALAGGNVRPALSSHFTDDCYSFGADM
jgi:hypothetical protein